MEHDEIISKSDFAQLCGVSQACVSQWLRRGMIGPEALVGRGRHARIKVKLASEMVRDRRVRFDDSAASDDLLAARARVVSAQAQLLEMRIAREQGELISKAAVFESIADVGRAVQRLFKNGVEWSEELYGAAQAGCGLGAFASMLRVRLIELNNSLSDMILAEAARYGDGGDDEGATNV